MLKQDSFRSYLFFSPNKHKFEDKKKIKKSDFYKNKKVFKIDEIDADKILVSKIEPYGTNKSIKYFIGYNDDDVIRPLCMKLPQMIGYVKCFDSNKAMSFKVTDKKLLKNYTKIQGKVSNLMDIKYESEPVYGDNAKYIKAKIKIYRDKVDKFSRQKSSKRKFICFFINNINSVRFCY